jgi:hypothetical protein
MKVLDLQCPHGHRFEGWFASAEEFESQLSRKLVECPVCSATEVSRLPSAPRLNLSGATATQAPAGAGEMQARVMRRHGAFTTTKRLHATFAVLRHPKMRKPWSRKALK